MHKDNIDLCPSEPKYWVEGGKYRCLMIQHKVLRAVKSLCNMLWITGPGAGGGEGGSLESSGGRNF